VGSQVARIVLLLLGLAFLVNVARGTGTTWLKTKFIGHP
jgi:hypothetical protein